MSGRSSYLHQINEARRGQHERVVDILRTVFINLVFTALVIVVGYSLVITYKLKHEETNRKKMEVEVAREQLARDVDINDQLKREAHFLRTADGVEKVAREQLGLIKPHETTYVVVNVPTQLPVMRPRTAPQAADEPPAAASMTAWMSKALTELWNGGD